MQSEYNSRRIFDVEPIYVTNDNLSVCVRQSPMQPSVLLFVPFSHVCP